MANGALHGKKSCGTYSHAASLCQISELFENFKRNKLLKALQAGTQVFIKKCGYKKFIIYNIYNTWRDTGFSLIFNI